MGTKGLTLTFPFNTLYAMEIYWLQRIGAINNLLTALTVLSCMGIVLSGIGILHNCTYEDRDEEHYFNVFKKLFIIFSIAAIIAIVALIFTPSYQELQAIYKITLIK